MKNTSTTTDRRIFDTAFALWTARQKVIETRQRLKRYTYGNQWGDIVSDENGNPTLECDWLVKNGCRSITNNLIRRLVKTIVGRYRNMAQENKWYDSGDQSYDSDEQIEEVDSRMLEEFLISGMAIQRVADDNPVYDRKAKVENVSPEAFFCNDFRDTRGCDIDMAGMLHDMSPAEITLRFGKNNPAVVKKIEERLADDTASRCSLTSAHFFTPKPGRYRIIEVWNRQYTPKGKLKWQARWFTPNGELLDSYTSPWRHGGHPFAIKFYPLTDGEIHSFVEDVVDQQQYINRLIVLMDKIMSTSAKGVLMYPEQQKPEKMSWDEVALRWASPSGIIPITGKTSLLPQQVNTSPGDTGAYRMLEMELKLFDQTSGVGTALLGTSSTAYSTGYEHLRQQVENATIALTDIFGTFRSFIVSRNLKLENLI